MMASTFGRMPRLSAGRTSMPKLSGKRMKPGSLTKKVGGIRTNFTQAIAPPKIGGKK